MRISERGQITIPKALRERYGLTPETEIELIPEDGGIQLRKKRGSPHPVDEVYGILGKRQRTDEYLKELRGR